MASAYITVDMRNLHPISEFVGTVAMLKSAYTEASLQAESEVMTETFAMIADQLDMALLTLNFDSEDIEGLMA